MQDTGIEDKVIDALRELAGAVGQTAETLWPMAVEATWAKAISTVAVCGFVSLFLAIVALVCWKVAKRFPEGSEPRFAFTIVPSVVWVFIFIHLAIAVHSALPSLIAPEGITLFRLLK